MSDLLFPIHATAIASAFEWRPYQLAATKAIQATLLNSSGCLAILPCGTGKTEIIVKLITTLVPPDKQAIVVSPLQSLVGQTASRLRLRGVPCGVEQGALRSDSRITVASYKSLISQNRYSNFSDNLGLVVVDESHLNYSKRAIEILSYYREAGAKIVGMTASPARMKGDPLSAFYGPTAYFYELQQAIADGWLVPPRVWLTVASELDLSQFDEGDGDYSAERLCREMARDANIQTVVQLVLQHHEREPSVVFCQGILQAEKVRDILSRRGGLESAIVHSRMEDDERDRHLAMFEDGTLNVIINVGCLTTGWDSPIVRKAFICKPTRSRTLYQQMVGRATRPLTGILDGLMTAEARRAAIAASDKPYFEIFDLVDASRHNDLITAMDALYPSVEPDLAARVSRKRPAGVPQDMSEIGRLIAAEQALIDEEARLAAEQAAARDELQWRQRAAWLAGVDFTTVERNAFAPAEDRPKKRGWRVLFGKHKGQLLADVDIGWLEWALGKCKLSHAYRGAIEREVRKRKG